MERQPQPRGRKKDRTGALISFVLHVLIIGVVAYFVSKTEIGMQIRDKLLGTTRDKKVEDRPKPPPAKALDKGKLKPPPGAPPASKARAVDAPAAVGEGIVVDDRTKREAGPARPTTTAPVVQPPAFKPPPKVFTTAPSSIKNLLAERAKASAVVESFGSEQISKSGVSDVGDIVSRISGATVAEGKFAVVRGLADRYTLSTLNGVDIPSADPDRRAVQLDLFPAQFLNRVDVNKTFQPDLPGGFAGGAINIVTRSFPDRPIFSFSIGTSYNTQSSLRDDFLFTDQGSYDFLAIDDETREMPKEARRTDPTGNRAVDSNIKNEFNSRRFGPVMDDSPVNSSMSLAFGDTTHLLGRPLGFLAGIYYKNDYNYYGDGKVTQPQFRSDALEPDEAFADVKSTIEYTWGSLATLAYQVSENHELNFNFMFVQTAEDEARLLRGQDANFGTIPGTSYAEKNILHWTERNLDLMQLKGGHLFPDLSDIRLDWVGSLASTSQEEPDQRIIQFLATPGDPNDPNDDSYDPNGPAKPGRPTRIWRELQEDNKSFRIDLTVPLSPYSGSDNSIKTGYFITQSEQTYESRAWEINNITSDNLFRRTGDPNDLLRSPTNTYNYYNFPANFEYSGEQTIEAGYIMGNWSPQEWVRLVGGVRYETTKLDVSTVNTTLDTDPVDASIDQKDLLPSLAVTFFLRPNLQLRAAWSETIIRPTYREISNAEVYDVARGRTIFGNPDLVLSSSENYDVRLEWYPRPGEIISLGGFYKKIDQPIELAAFNVSNDEIFYNNYDYADVFGFELELRKNFRGFWGAPYDQFSLGFNYAYIKSEVPRTDDQKEIQELYAGDTSDFRPLYDQPEYVLNADLTWDSFISGTSITLSGGVVGRRLVLVGLGTPDEYEEPAPQLEFSISQKFGRHWKARFSAKNLLDPIYEVTQEYPVGTVSVESYTKGMQFGLSIGCDF